MKQWVLSIIALAGFALLLLGGCGHPYPTNAFRPKNIGRTLSQAVQVEVAVKARAEVPLLLETTLHSEARAQGDTIDVRTDIRVPLDPEFLEGRQQ